MSLTYEQFYGLSVMFNLMLLAAHFISRGVYNLLDPSKKYRPLWYRWFGLNSDYAQRKFRDVSVQVFMYIAAPLAAIVPVVCFFVSVGIIIMVLNQYADL